MADHKTQPVVTTSEDNFSRCHCQICELEAALREAEEQRDAWDERAAMEFREKERQRGRAEALAAALRLAICALDGAERHVRAYGNTKSRRFHWTVQNRRKLAQWASSNARRALAGEPREERPPFQSVRKRLRVQMGREPTEDEVRRDAEPEREASSG